MNTKMLPQGHCSSNPSNENKRCDLPSCTVTGDEDLEMFDGCSHSFHCKCISDDLNFCPLCQQFLREKAKQLSQTAINAILHGNLSESVDRVASLSDNDFINVSSKNLAEGIPHCCDEKDNITNDDEEASDNDTTTTKKQYRRN